MMEDLGYLSATRLLDLYRDRSVSPVEVGRGVFDRITAHNSALNAFCLIDEEATLAQARASEDRWVKGEPVGRLDGVPTSIKDVVLTSGWPTRRGSTQIDPDQPWEEDAPCVARLREHGAVLLGKTTTPEFGWKGVTDSPLTGISRNPWDLAKTPGGSSGGASAAVVAGMGPLAVGSDGGGSIRIPSSFCGAVGIKASFGRVPAYPASPFGTLSHVGPIARTVADAALMLTAISEPDSRDLYSLPPDGRDYTVGLDDGVKDLRVAFSPDLGWARVDPEIAEAVGRAAGAFEALGARVEETSLSLAEAPGVFKVLWYVGAKRVVDGFDAAQQKALDPGLRTIAEQGAEYDLAAYLDAIQARTALGERLRAFHDDYDLLLTPTMPTAAFEAGQDAPIGPNGEKWVDWSPFTYPFNLTSQPAATVPCGFTAGGLPVGLQIVGANYADGLVLRAAQAYQMANSTLDRKPAL